MWRPSLSYEIPTFNFLYTWIPVISQFFQADTEFHPFHLMLPHYCLLYRTSMNMCLTQEKSEMRNLSHMNFNTLLSCIHLLSVLPCWLVVHHMFLNLSLNITQTLSQLSPSALSLHCLAGGQAFYGKKEVRYFMGEPKSMVTHHLASPSLCRHTGEHALLQWQ